MAEDSVWIIALIIIVVVCIELVIALILCIKCTKRRYRICGIYSKQVRIYSYIYISIFHFFYLMFNHLSKQKKRNKKLK